MKEESGPLEVLRPYLTPHPLLVVLSGPSGVGKDAVLNRMKEMGYPYHFTVTATTRPRRSSETDGVEYLFLSQAQYDRMVKQGEFLEWARVYGHGYGVPKRPVQQALQDGKDVVVKADVQGAATLRKLAPQAVLIFLAPPSLEELERRLARRKTESPADAALRIRTAREEMERLPLFDYVVVNYYGRLDDTVARVHAIITAEKSRVPPRRVQL